MKAYLVIARAFNHHHYNDCESKMMWIVGTGADLINTWSMVASQRPEKNSLWKASLCLQACDHVMGLQNWVEQPMSLWPLHDLTPDTAHWVREGGCCDQSLGQHWVAVSCGANSCCSAHQQRSSFWYDMGWCWVKIMCMEAFAAFLRTWMRPGCIHRAHLFLSINKQFVISPLDNV